MIRTALVTLLGCVLGCANSEEPPSIFTRGPAFEDGGPARVCGVVPNAACANEGKEIARCLCGSFEEQVGRLVCCRDGRASIEPCQQASKAVDCAGRPLQPEADGG